MTVPDTTAWSELLRRTLTRYREELLRAVAARLLRPRNFWPTEELIERSVAAMDNPAIIDRRLQDVEPASRQALALIGLSRQPSWALGNLVEMLMTLGHADGLKPVLGLLEAGLAYPLLEPEPGSPAPSPAPATIGTLASFEQWLAAAGPTNGLRIFTHPLIASRALGENLGLPDLTSEADVLPKPAPPGEGGVEEAEPEPPPPPPAPAHAVTPPQEADGLEWLLRLAVLWQQVSGAPLRRTQQGSFFKRDLERLQQDPLLNGPPADRLAEVPDTGFFLVALAEREGIVLAGDGELRLGKLPAVWDRGLAPALESLWRHLPRLEGWTPRDGWLGPEAPAGNPFASAGLLAFLLLARVPSERWIAPSVLETWLRRRHPYWAGTSLRPSQAAPWMETYLLGVAHQMRLVQAARDLSGAWLVRLSPTGRWLLGQGDAPALDATYSQTLLVQPNLEIIAYRQGLTAGLVGRLTRFAAWRSLGAACTLQLGPETVYRALESGQSFDSIRLTLEQHGTRAIPPAVLDSLRTWSNKRDRITVYPSATLLEFASAEDLNDALARGLPGVRLSDTLAVVASEAAIEFRHFRLTGTRDYALPPDRCVTVEPDGVTLTIDVARSDLLLETEVPRFAELQSGASANGKRQYRLTPASLSAARASGLLLSTLDSWSQQRAGQPLPPAARMLLVASQLPPPQLEHQLVLQVASADLADGLMQWPETRTLILSRLGPTALVVTEDNAPLLRAKLRAIGMTLSEEG
jgi:hypothetical protein